MTKRAGLVAAWLMLGMAPMTGWADEPVVRITSGASHIEKNIPYPVSVTRPLLSVAGGLRLTDRSSAALRLESFRFDGTEVQLSLAADLHLHRLAGLWGAAGIAGNDPGRLGSIVTLGLFGQFPATDRVAIRVEAYYQRTRRSDFGGNRTALTAGVELRWP